MQYPLYNYYFESRLTLSEIIDNFVCIYTRKHGRNKVDNIISKVSNSTKIAALDSFSIQKRVMPNYVDFGSAINGTLWFAFQSNTTQALAVLIAAQLWHERVNTKYQFCSYRELRDNALTILKKFRIYEEMTKEEYDEMTKSLSDINDEEELQIGNYENKTNGYHILNFYLDCSYWHKQENEIKKYPLLLPVQIVDVDKEDDIVDKYKVNNLPTLILVDHSGKEIHRWVGVTPTSEINKYLSDNNYSDERFEKKNLDSIPAGLPTEIKDKIKDPIIMDKLISILAEGGTEAQIKEKVDYLFGIKQKSNSMSELEKRIRAYIRRQFDIIGEEVLPEDGRYDDIMQKMYATKVLSDLSNELDDNKYSSEVAKLKEMANNNGINWYAIKDEELKRALSIYRDGKSDCQYKK